MAGNVGVGNTSAGQVVEDFPAGYPRYSALLSSHSSFHVCRQFLRLRSRLLLYKQDSIAALEDELDRIDREESRVLFLGNRRRDRNVERQELMKKVDQELAEYGMSTIDEVSQEIVIRALGVLLTKSDALVRRHWETLRMEAAEPRDITNLQNWLKQYGCIAREEVQYLSHKSDLMALGSFSIDKAVSRLQGPIEDSVMWLSRKIRKLDKLNIRLKISRDPTVFIMPDSWLSRFGRLLMSSLLGITLIIPVVIVETIRPLVSRFVATFFGITFFLAALFGLTRAKTVEVFIAGATYAAVLTVFLDSGNGGNCCKGT